MTEHLKKHSTPYFCILTFLLVVILALQIEKDYQAGVEKDQMTRLWRKQTAKVKPAQSLNEAEAIHQALHPPNPTSQVIANHLEAENEKQAVNIAPKELLPQKFAGVNHFPLKEVSKDSSKANQPIVGTPVISSTSASKTPTKSLPTSTTSKSLQNQRPIAGISMDQRKLASRLLKMNSEPIEAAAALAKEER